MPNLTGKVAIVTGATKGIGLAIAERMINEGMRVAVSARTEQDVAEVEGRLGENALGVPCDVADPAAYLFNVAELSWDFAASSR